MKTNKIGLVPVFVFVMLAFIFTAEYVHAASYYVPDNYATIQSAIDASVDGDTILVRPGTYYEQLSVTKSITLQSTNGAPSTIIDGSNSGSVLTIINTTPVIDGFTITHGNSYSGGGVYIISGYGLNPTIKNCVIRGNTSSGNGGGVFASNYGVNCGGSTFDAVEISSNHATGEGGGLHYGGCGSATISNSRILNNTSDSNGGGLSSSGLCAMIRLFTSIVSGNTAGGYGGGMFTGDYVPSCGPISKVYSSLISSNSATVAGGGLYVGSYGWAEHYQTTIVNNAAPQGGGLYIDGGAYFGGTIIWNNTTPPVNLSAEYSDVEGGAPPAGTGNISADPLFVNPTTGDYHLTLNSPCKDTGGAYGGTDVDGNPRPIGMASDMGAYEFVEDSVITATAGNGGGISPSGAVTVPYNTNQTFTITPAAGYQVFDVLVDGSSVGAATSYTFSNVTTYHTITASFGRALTVTKGGTGTGTVTVDNGAIIWSGDTGTAVYDTAITVNVTAVPDSGSVFAGWSGDCTGTGACLVTMDTNHSISASFTRNSITVTSPNGGENWTRGTTHSITWSYTGNPGSSVKIELLKGGTLDSTMTTGTSIGSNGSGSYSWAIPQSQTRGTDYTVRVTSTTESTSTDTSDGNFTISK